MRCDEFKFINATGQSIHYYRWKDTDDPIAAVQILHGMAEHAARYDDFACFLAGHGFAVYAHDMRGHGHTAGSLENTGHISDFYGMENAINDAAHWTEFVVKENRYVPRFLLGHSMGSLLARYYIARKPGIVDGLILSGTSYTPEFLLKLGRTIANIQIHYKGRRHRSKLLNRLSFGSFNKRFKPARTKFDWLSRDEAQVDKYVNDEYCGFVCTTAFFENMFETIRQIQSDRFMTLTRPNLPVYLFSGEMDAVGNYTKGVKKTYELYRKYGVTDIEMKLYKDGRHEMLNEINKKEVYEDVLKWMMKRIKKMSFTSCHLFHVICFASFLMTINDYF